MLVFPGQFNFHYLIMYKDNETICNNVGYIGHYLEVSMVLVRKSNCLLFILYNLQGEKRVRKDIKYYFFCNAEFFKFFILEMATQFLVKAL